jgi:hypothetical protein
MKCVQDGGGRVRGACGEDAVGKREFWWRVFLAWSVLFAGAVLLLPVDVISDRGGGLETWFVLYLASGASAISFMGMLIRTGRTSRGSCTVCLQDDLSTWDLEGLDAEDRELLWSLRELREWYTESLRQVLSGMHMKSALEKWYHLAITKEIEIRNLRRYLRQLKERSKSKMLPIDSSVSVKPFSQNISQQI